MSSNNSLNTSLRASFIGAGNMGSALIKAACGSLDSSCITVYDTDAAKTEELKKNLNINIADDISQCIRDAEYIFLCVKPHIIAPVICSISSALEDARNNGQKKCLISIAAGMKVDTVREKLPEACRTIDIIRIMPNIPAIVGQGMLALYAPEETSSEKVEAVITILSKAGRIDKLNESLIDQFTSVSGCSPAYICMFAEALADGAVAVGLPRDKAYIYAAQALLGTASMLLETGLHPGELKDMVCSPGGSTIEGVIALERGGFRNAVIESVKDSFEKNLKLGKN